MIVIFYHVCFTQDQSNPSSKVTPVSVHDPDAFGSPLDSDAIREKLLDNVKALKYADISHIIYNVGNKTNVSDAEEVLYGIATAADFGYLELGGRDGYGYRTATGEGQEHSPSAGKSSEGSGEEGTGVGRAEQDSGVRTQPGAFSFPEPTSGVMYSASTPDRSFADMVERYGAIEQGKGPRERDIDFPNIVRDELYVSKFMCSVMESSHVTNDRLASLQQKVLGGEIGMHLRELIVRI